MKSQAIETTLAANRLKQLKVSEICAYEDLHAVIGMDPQDGKGYGYVLTARAIVERELECVLDALPNVGIKRLAPREVVNRGGKDLRHVRRSVRAGLRRQTTIVPLSMEMGQEERSRFNLQLSYFGMLEMVTSRNSRKTVEARVVDAARVLPPAETAALFSRKEND